MINMITITTRIIMEVVYECINQSCAFIPPLLSALSTIQPINFNKKFFKGILRLNMFYSFGWNEVGHKSYQSWGFSLPNLRQGDAFSFVRLGRWTDKTIPWVILHVDCSEHCTPWVESKVLLLLWVWIQMNTGPKCPPWRRLWHAEFSNLLPPCL